MKTVFVWILVTSLPSTPVTYSIPTVSESDCLKIKSAIVAYETRRFSNCVKIPTIID